MLVQVIMLASLSMLVEGLRHHPGLNVRVKQIWQQLERTYFFFHCQVEYTKMLIFLYLELWCLWEMG
jgi:hypothetical protein